MFNISSSINASLSANHSSIVKPTPETCLISIDPYIRYLFEGVSNSLGVVFNFICIIIFYQIIRNENHTSNMFYFFLVKSINDFVMFVSNSFEWFYFCENCGTKSEYWMQLWYIYFYYYLEEICFTASGLLEIFATLDCFSLITKKIKGILLKKNIIIIVAAIYLFNCSFLIFYIFRSEIKGPIVANTSIYGKPTKTAFYKTETFQYLHLSKTIMRDYITLVVIVVLNVLILFNITELNRARRTRTHNIAKSKLLLKSRRAESNKVKMIIFNGLNYLMGHLPVSMNSLLPNFGIRSFQCYSYIFFDIMVFSYVTPILIYYFFNTNFKRNLISLITFEKC
jgi:hypothetical protein